MIELINIYWSFIKKYLFEGGKLYGLYCILLEQVKMNDFKFINTLKILH